MFGSRWAHFGIGRVYRLSQDGWPWVEHALFRLLKLQVTEVHPSVSPVVQKRYGNPSEIEDSIT
jgi:hypothetical protein